MNDFKTVLMGDAEAGKTALYSRLTADHVFPLDYKQTVGATLKCKIISEKKIGIWDTAGAQRFMSLSRFYAKNAGVIFYCIDLTKPLDYEKIKDNIKTFKEESGRNSHLILVGTKSDLCPNAETILSEIQSNITEADSIVITSAKDNVGLDKLENAISTQLSSLEEQKKEHTSPPIVSTDHANYLPSQFSDDQVAAVVKHIETLKKEINSFWPYPNKDRKQEKITALDNLLKAAKDNTTDLVDAINSLSNNSSVRKGHLSTRTADLLDRLLAEVGPNNNLSK